MNFSNGRHSREDVVVAALAILDSLGLPDLTMRRLAAALDVQASALYWHFPSKQALLASVSDRIVARAGVLTDLGTGWRDATSVQASALRDALLGYRDGAEIVSSSLALGLGGGEALTGLRSAIALGEFDSRTSDIAAAALLHFILGHVFHEQQRLQADSLGVVSEQYSAGLQQLDIESDAFVDGVTLLLNGLEFELRQISLGAAPG